jgi:hypothetical protein
VNSKNTSILPKLISGVLAAVLLLPMLIFTALPNTMFGYNSAMDQRVADFTASARRLTNAYQNIAQKNQSAMERLVNSILPGFSDYDDYHVTDGSGGMNQNWLIAIGSVRYKQDLNVMDGNALEDLLFGKLDYSASITDRVLNISVWDLTPEAYMDRLGFSQEEKDWAALLYSVMEEDQRVSIGDTDGSGYYGTDYGDVVFSNTITPVVYYNQTDARWGNEPYGKTSTIGRAGCGPTALAIAVASLTDNRVTPYEVAQWSMKGGYVCEGSGSYHSLISNGGRHYGLTVTSIGRDGKKLVEALQEGKLVIAIMSKGHFTNSGHFIVLRGVTEDGKLLVADPASVKRSDKEWDLRIVTSEASRKIGSAGGPFWVLSP